MVLCLSSIWKTSLGHSKKKRTSESDKRKNACIMKISELSRNKIPTEELEQLRKGLMDKWLYYNTMYQKLTHRKHFSSDVERTRKEQLEKVLLGLENDLKLLSHKNIELDSRGR